MITICMGCTRIRTDDGPWTYDAAPASGASHGYCEDCEAEQQAMVDKFAERIAAEAAHERGGAECSDG